MFESFPIGVFPATIKNPGVAFGYVLPVVFGSFIRDKLGHFDPSFALVTKVR